MTKIEETQPAKPVNPRRGKRRPKTTQHQVFYPQGHMVDEVIALETGTYPVVTERDASTR